VKTLYLLRHAKSSWKNPRLDDFERPLNARGRAAAQALGRFMAAHDIRPDIVLCSTAARARETLAYLFDAPPPTRFEPDLYLATPERLLAFVRRLDDRADSALVIGHNPGLATLARALAASAEDRGPASFAGKIPTGALAVFELDVVGWAEVAPGRALVASLTRPRDLG